LERASPTRIDAMTDFPLPHASTNLDGHVALVSGASSGLGRRFARVLANAGAAVVGLGRRMERLQALADEIHADGGRCLTIAGDVRDAASLPSVLDRAERDFGVVDVLINNAGIPDAAHATKIPLELVDQLLEVNVRAPFVLAREVAKRLIAARKPGRIVNLSSIAAYHYAGNGAALYAVTKAAVARMTEVLAVEWAAFGINVNGIVPGFFASEMTDGMIARIGDFSDSLPRKRIGDPAQLDSTLLYLCAPASECVTGTNVKVADGQFPA
jgi:NAD(P)-dependent dehydrogenase (short-subunit alcohol dehydrogenase family)